MKITVKKSTTLLKLTRVFDLNGPLIAPLSNMTVVAKMLDFFKAYRQVLRICSLAFFDGLLMGLVVMRRP